MSVLFDVRNLVFRYPKSKEDILKGISFTVETGQIFGLLGPSGAGKSTTQKILIKILNNYQGEIFYRGKDLRTYDKSFYEDIGVGFEMPVHFNKLTARENMKYFASFYQRHLDCVALMEKLNLADAIDMEVGQFSKGMKVRLNFVRAMLNNPRVLFLDEPTAGIDPANARIIKDLILDFKKRGGTVFITTHLMSDVEQLCDEVIFMTDGMVGKKAAPRDLKIQYGNRLVTVEYYDDAGLRRQQFDLKDLGHNRNFLDIISRYDIETIHSGETSLEEIFIIVTGANNE
ncbi:MAG: ABC transporter ATP-binding protein [Bacilli bacterium]|nr:ABC transporter ATP-binding protein [Bacilli bacterium]